MRKSTFKSSLVILALVASVTVVKASASEIDLQLKTSPKFKGDTPQLAYVDKLNGVFWYKALPGTYTNGCRDTDGHYDESKCTIELRSDGTYQVREADSEAAKACKKMNARLPNKQEVDSLIRNFNHQENGSWPQLTLSGIDAMRIQFGDDMNTDYCFWSSYVPYNYIIAHGLCYEFGQRLSLYRFYAYPVRCVSGP